MDISIKTHKVILRFRPNHFFVVTPASESNDESVVKY